MNNTVPYWNQQLAQFLVDTFKLSPPTLLGIFIGSSCAILCITCVIIMCCCKGRQKTNTSNNENRRGILRMFAKLDEFESLTPLIVTPGSTPSASKLASPSTAFDAPSTSKSRSTAYMVHDVNINRLAPRPTRAAHLEQRLNFPPKQTILVSGAPVRMSSDSPPPPRKNPTGKTLIVPLGPNNNNRQSCSPINQLAPLLGTPDSRVTSFEAGTTKSCATIPEGDESDLDSENAEPEQSSMDLVSIDRTYGSVPVPIRVTLTSAYDIQEPIKVPEFKVPTPCYTPPAPPSIGSTLNGQSPRSIKRSNHFNNAGSRMNDSPNLSSPDGSSCGLGSPIDTTGSLSDSFLLPSEEENDHKGRTYDVIAAEKKRQEPSNSSMRVSEIELTDSERRQLPPLQRIEEESENYENSSVVYSVTGSQFDQERNVIPRSISQQLAMMHHEKERRAKTKAGNEK